MFYISRREKTVYGVVDDTDGVEEFYDYSDLCHLVIDKGISILGCTITGGFMPLLAIEPYCTLDTATLKSLYFMYGIKLGVYNSTLVHLNLRDVKRDCTLVLSKYVKSISSYCNFTPSSRGIVTLVFDNKLEIGVGFANNLYSKESSALDFTLLDVAGLSVKKYNKFLRGLYQNISVKHFTNVFPLTTYYMIFCTCQYSMSALKTYIRNLRSLDGFGDYLYTLHKDLILCANKLLSKYLNKNFVVKEMQGYLGDIFLPNHMLYILYVDDFSQLDYSLDLVDVLAILMCHMQSYLDLKFLLLYYLYFCSDSDNVFKKLVNNIVSVLDNVEFYSSIGG